MSTGTVDTRLLERRLLLLKRKRKAVLAHDSLLDFAQLMSTDPQHPDDVDYSSYVLAKHHRAIADAMQRVERGDIKRLMIQCPPRHGKTRLASHMFMSWYAGRNPGKHAILGTYNEKFSWDHGRDIRKIMNTPLYRQVFPNTTLSRGSKAVDRLATSNGAVLQFVGRSGTITGRGGDVMILDDPIKNREEADSKLIRDKLWKWYVADIASRQMTKKAAIVIICTRWHEDDLIGRLTDPNNPCYNKDEAAEWYKIDLPAIAEHGDPLGREEGEPTAASFRRSTRADRHRMTASFSAPITSRHTAR